MYRPHRKLRWNAESERVVAEKRALLAEKGIVTDEQVCEWFKAQGVDCEPEDVHPMMMDAASMSPFEKVMSALGGGL